MNTTSTPSPKDFGIPHAFWRPNQYEAFIQARNLQEQGGYMFAELGTGSGKSALATGLGKDHKVHVLVHTLGLLEQYEKEYGFVGIKGRDNYACVLPNKVEEWKEEYQKVPTASDCHFNPMQKCPAKDECPYLIAREKMFRAQRSISTYRYAALSNRISQSGFDLICDEAHSSSEEIISYSTLTISPNDIHRFGLPMYPFLSYGLADEGDILDPEGREMLSSWFSQCIAVIRSQYGELDGEEATMWASQLRGMLNRLVSARERLQDENWFLVFEGDGSRRQMYLRALTAGQAARRLFERKRFVMFMSATIGNPVPLARELGLMDEDYSFISFPHPVPASFRPIHNLHSESMSAYNLRRNPRLYQIQARLIWNWIEGLDPDWRGAIVTTSYRKIQEMAHYLRQWMPSSRRLLVQGGDGKTLTNLIGTFIEDQQKGDIVLGTIQGWGSGLNFFGDIARFMVVAGVPHQNPTDAYAKARRRLSGGEAYQMWVTYNAIMQACGRVSRGEQDASGGWITSHAALADGMATTQKAMSYFGGWFKEALV